MKLAFLGDTHFGVRNGNNHFHDFFNKFYTDIFFPHLVENKIDIVIQLGDLYDSRTKINPKCAFQSNNYFFKKFEEYGIELISIIGNHDIFAKESLQINSPSIILSGFNNIEIIGTPKTYTFDDVSFDFIPWICKENYDEVIKFIDNSNSINCIIHGELEGFRMHKDGIISKHRMSPSVFSHYDKVLSGHYHSKSSKNNIFYLGTPYEMSWSDYDDQKGFHVYDTKTRELEFIENPYSIYIKESYDDSNSDENTSKYLTFDYLEQFKNKYVKIQVENKTNPHLYDLFLDQLESVNPIDINPIEISVNLNLEETDIIDEGENTLTIINKYVDDVSNPELCVDKLKNMMSNLYNDAVSVGVSE